ncbi:Crp/Fnr family transcriptional regulator [Myroides sp. DF42-4-2]|uniref:Crp/Fnr family transcriptional regulator n=1 Tax=Myroides sp. DF42-4-2 TaxID=2746726 RepID=UPI0025750CA7|nr:Crp/Fnr family transcriptional regulator [Myroides sp. DF42-4-2]MDM1408416.1 Crp/Fnr family transcriptional regulator [Myroides sp. DF42-4-2]
MNNTTLLIQHIERFTGPLLSVEATAIASFFKMKSLAKKEIIQQADAPCDVMCFVLKGCMRSYYLKENGIEQTVDFAIENWWMTDFLAFEQQASSSFSLQAVERTEIFYLSSREYTSLLRAHPIMEKYFRAVFQKAFGAAQHRLKFLYAFSREELYFHFEEQFPAFVQRIPQYLLASYLGFSPEYLSEIRKKRFS